MKKKILIVDDKKEIINFLEHFLIRFNLTVIKAISGQEAVSCYHQYKPEYVFLDIQMPDKDGITVLKELKKIDPALKIIMITGKEDDDSQKKAKKYGAIDYVTKPLDLSELSKKIQKYIL